LLRGATQRSKRLRWYAQLPAGPCSGVRSPLRSGPKAMQNGGGGVLERSGMPAPLTNCWPCADVLSIVFPSAHLSRHNAAHAHNALAAESQRESLPHLSKRHLNEFRSRISLEEQSRLAAHRSSPRAAQLHQSLPQGGTRCHCTPLRRPNPTSTTTQHSTRHPGHRIHQCRQPLQLVSTDPLSDSKLIFNSPTCSSSRRMQCWIASSSSGCPILLYTLRDLTSFYGAFIQLLHSPAPVAQSAC